MLRNIYRFCCCFLFINRLGPGVRGHCVTVIYIVKFNKDVLHKTVCLMPRARKAKLFHNGVLKPMLSICATTKNLPVKRVAVKGFLSRCGVLGCIRHQKVNMTVSQKEKKNKNFRISASETYVLCGFPQTHMSVLVLKIEP